MRRPCTERLRGLPVLIPATPPQLAYQAEPPVFLSDEGDSDLRAYVQTLSEQRWLVLWVALTVLVAGTLYALMARPAYEASLMLHVEEKGQRGQRLQLVVVAVQRGQALGQFRQFLQLVAVAAQRGQALGQLGRLQRASIDAAFAAGPRWLCVGR